MAVYAFINLKKKDILSFGIIIYLIGILPFSNFYKPAPGIVAERFAYTASLGFCIIVAIILLRIFKITFQSKAFIRKFKPQFIIVITAILGLYSVLTISRNNNWKDVSTLYHRDVEHFDKSYNLHYLLVTNLTSQINNTAPGPLRDKLISELREHQLKIAEIVSKDIEKYPKDYISRNNLGSIYVNYTDEQIEARKLLRQAIAVKPDYSEAYYNMAYSYEKSNNIDSAIYFYNKTLEMESSFINIYLKLHELYTCKGEYSKAFEIDERSMKIFPDDAGFYINAGNTCMLMKDTLKGISYLEKAVDIEPSNFNMRAQIVSFLKKYGFADKAKQLESK
jgi:tetratricopeptide (TPR) repeat protein